MSTKTRWLGLAMFTAAAPLMNCVAPMGIERFTSAAQAQVQAMHGGANDDVALLKPGVVVEEVERNSAAARAGIQAGDVLLTWSRGDAAGPIESPFDVSWIEIEQEPRGPITVEGLRGTEKRSWALGPDVWAIQTRPNFQGSILEAYREGQQYSAAGKLPEAMERWRTIAKQSNGTASFWLLEHGADTLAKGRQWKEADDAYQEAVTQARNVGPSILASVLRAWAQSFNQRSDWANAEKYYQQAITEGHKLDHESLMIALNIGSLGLAAWQKGDLAKAEEYLRQALEIQQKLAPESFPVARSLVNLGSAVFRQGNLAMAEEYYHRALDIEGKLEPGGLAVAGCFMGLGAVARMRGDFAKAEEYQHQALAIQEKLVPGSFDAANSLTNLGIVAGQRGDLAMAEEYHRQALEIRQKLAPASLTVAASFNNLGLVAELRGDLAKAEDYHRQALDIEQKLAPGSLAVASSFNNLGLVAGDRGDWTKAEKYLRQALEIKLKLAPESLDAANTYAGLGEVAWKRGDLAGAEANHRRALEIREKLAPGSSSHAETLASLAEIMRRKGQPEAAAQLFDQALNAVESQGARLGGSQDIRAGFRAQFDAYYRDYVDLLVEQAQQERAFAVLEHSRARSLLEMLAEAHLDVHEGIDSALLKEERSLHAEIAAKTNRRVSLLTGKHTEEQAAAITKEIEGLIARHQAVQGEIRSSSPGYAALTQPELLNAKEIQLLLDPDTLLLEYSLGAERSHAFAVSTKSMAAFDLPPRKQIEQTARRLYWLMTERNRNIQDETEAQRSQRWQRADAAYNKAAYDLSRMILGPAATQLRGKRLLVVADGALHYIPFAALPDPTAAQTTNHPQQVPLAFNHEIVNLPSASVLAVLRQNEVRPHPAPKVVAVLADPVFTSADSRVRVNAASRVSIARRDKRERNEGALTSDLSATLLTRSAADVGLSHGGRLRLPRLLFSRREADAILAVTPDGLGLKAVDFDANRAMATSPELAQYRIVHFATHGLLDSQHPELSGLVLSLVDQQGRPQDGFLQLQDIYNMNLAADLVVLSACETGLGKEVDGEGLIGLTRGFMYAGATRVVSSLWKISDFATAKLMKAFYTAMEQEGKRPAEALREAQLSLAKDSRWSAPYYWAGFTIQGEWK